MSFARHDATNLASAGNIAIVPLATT